MHVVVTGPPGSGKSTLSRPLAGELGLPLAALAGAVLDSVWVEPDRAAGKKPGHFDEQRPDDELWPAASLRPLAGGWPVLEVDTTAPVDVRRVAEQVRRTRSRP